MRLGWVRVRVGLVTDLLAADVSEEERPVKDGDGGVDGDDADH